MSHVLGWVLLASAVPLALWSWRSLWYWITHPVDLDELDEEGSQ
jgi:hypothetical protein